jgi:hypothetical protein
MAIFVNQIDVQPANIKLGSKKPYHRSWTRTLKLFTDKTIAVP